MKKRVCLALIVLMTMLCVVLVSCARDDSSAEYLEYVNWRDEWYQVYSTENAEGDIVIPSTYKDLPVLAINKNGFANREKITSINIPISVTEIESGAFTNCTSLKSIHIPKSVTIIAEGAFIGCSSLTNITVDNDNPAFSGEGNCLIRKSDNAVIAGCQASVIPSTVSSIAIAAFAGITISIEFTIPNNVTEIGYYAFRGALEVEKLTISKNVQEIAYSTFNYCPNLKLLNLKKTVLFIL